MADRFKRFQPHEDGVQEIISGEHVNELQDQVEKNQEENFRQEDIDFLDKALFILSNHPIVNSLYVDLIEDTTKIDMATSTSLAFSSEERSISFDTTGAVQGVMQGRLYQNPNNTGIKEIIFMANTDIPEGTRIEFEVSNNGLDFYNIQPNESTTFTFPTTGSKLQVKATFTRPYDAESPVLKAYGIIFRDPKYVISLLEDNPLGDNDDGTATLMSHNDLTDIGPDDHHPKMHTHDGTDGSGLVSHKSLTDIGEDDHHNKNHQHGQDGVDFVNLDTDVVGTIGMNNLPIPLFTGREGDVELTFNPLADDKLVIVKSPDDQAFLFYDWENDGRLGKVITIMGEVEVEEILHYGAYVNSQGVTEIVLTGTSKDVRDANDANVALYTEAVMAPKPVEEGV